MLGIHNQPNVMVASVPFKGQVSELKYDIESERDEKMDQFQKDQADWNEFADNLEKSDSKVAKKASKVVRVGASLLGLAATFIGAKYGSKVAIESVKSLANNGTGKTIIESLKNMKDPIVKAYKAVAGQVKKVSEMPVVKEAVDKLAKSKVGQTVIKTIEDPKVAKILDPIKKGFGSIKDIKFDGKKIQNIIENTMAITTTGSVVVDNLAGRNENKSTAELATGV